MEMIDQILVYWVLMLAEVLIIEWLAVQMVDWKVCSRVD